ncbi:MAG: hypothetical protein H7Z13_19155 [Ferruginibacter sp.]|nr:hypothetical protein [Ferruginibacter sp.]
MKAYNLLTTGFFCVLFANISSCTSSEIGNSKDVAPETIYQQYLISYKEGEENATFNAQFRFAGENGTTLVLTRPSSIELDGVIMDVDSSDFEGAFYKKSIPFTNFCDHHFTFTDINHMKYDNKFSFNPIQLSTIPETASNNHPLHIQYLPGKLGPADYIEIQSLETDSSFNITHSGKDTDQFISISAEEIKRQKGDQLKLAVTYHKKIDLQQNTKEGGALEIVYVLKPVTIKLR